MSGKAGVTNVIVAGLGGQGVLTCSDILAEAAFRTGFDVKKAEVHGMSQRGGSVACDVRFGEAVLSPMVPPGEADVLVVLADDQVDVHRHVLRDGGLLLTSADIDTDNLTHPRSANVALLGALSRHFGIDENAWRDAICQILPAKLHEINLHAFTVGRDGGTTS